MDGPSKQQLFKLDVFLSALDNCLTQAKLRFEGHSGTVELFRCLYPKFIRSNSDDTVREAAKMLQRKYKNDLSPDFVDQLQYVKVDFRDKDTFTTLDTPRSLINMIIKHELECLYPDVVTAIVLFLTIPVTVATAERSFSKLKLIKSYLRSTMTQDRLSNLAFLSIENEEAQKIDRKDIIRRFASAKAGRSKRFMI